MGIRKNQSSLTPSEKSAFVAAVKALKASGDYDIFVAQHRAAFLASPNDPAHGGPAFLPWHREYLARFERALQEIDPSVSIPYWDWTVDRTATASIWNADFMGGNGTGGSQRVTTGPFAFSTGEWNLTVLDPGDTTPFLTRAFGAMGSLPTQSAVDAAKNVVPYDSSPWNSGSSMNTSFRNRLEGVIHNPGHMWVGGSMMAMSSPNDPVFWLHHCNIDRLWAEWQRENPSQDYRPASGTPNVVAGHGLDDPMPPWDEEATPPTPRSVLDHHALDYTYDNEEPETPQVVALTIDAAPAAASIAQAGEVDVFSFAVTAPGSYIVETQGSTDVVASLYGPNNMATFITEDDDSGPGTNSRITRNLGSGTYYVRVRHYSSSSVGGYSISVRGSATQPGVQTIQVNGPAVQGTIAAPNERDMYTFTVATSGMHIIETAGSTDCFVTLSGPDNPATFIAQDDDSGPGANSRIAISLAPGTYFARVRHYSPSGTGAYSISVRA
ncbi:tyrosinase family protein [Nitrosovibrio sp. Nv4]|uniref:tyrosinase family protein n=1 Tax=Nitrosovibrio sp. Nv4 TaxID=1945880 RepID=UPI000BD2AF11|nr:tyrosinase family protein [Nitrosovibrio sp. Nv4]SOD42556.1 tyrosinase [Nitrosovibrio sp. Nv4]